MRIKGSNRKNRKAPPTKVRNSSEDKSRKNKHKTVEISRKRRLKEDFAEEK